MNENRALPIETHIRLPDNGSPFLVFRLSWVAYVRETWAFVLRLLLCGGLAALISLALERFAQMHNMAWLTLVGLALAVAWSVYSILLTRSVRLFTDDNGVWRQAGVFPWDRGISGVQWRDLGQAGYTQGFASWALRSYDVQVSHRFTTGSELVLRNVHRGNLAVEHINQVMAQLQGRVLSASVQRP